MKFSIIISKFDFLGAGGATKLPSENLEVLKMVWLLVVDWEQTKRCCFCRKSLNDSSIQDYMCLNRDFLARS